MTLLYICFLFGLIAGLLIGAAGIGGVILVPLLVYVAGIDIHTSIAASVAAFSFQVWLARLYILNGVSFNGQILYRCASVRYRARYWVLMCYQK